MRLSSHFYDHELGLLNASERVTNNAIWLCTNILEPVRDHFQQPVHVTSGYRNPQRNAGTGGVSNSYHLYEADHAAADFIVFHVAVEDVFNWLRQSRLPFHKVIMERDHGTGQPTVVHVQVHAGNPPAVRQAFIGETHGTAGYTEVECA
jgi:hypothetical protein